jgi:hypothetical protein
MRIDGKGFLVLLGVCTLVLAVLTVWLWPRLAGRDRKALAGRIGLLLATQLSLAATFLFTVNALGGFYTSWGQLFGTASAKYTVTDKGAADPALGDAKALGTIPGALQLTGPRSGVTEALQVYPPAGYTGRADAQRAYPVEVVDSTGIPVGPDPSVYQQVANTYQVIVVIVGAGSPGPAVPGVNVPHGAQGELFWAQDLQGALRARYRVAADPADWAVVGDGQDGTAAINLAVQDPDHYGLAAAIGDWTHTDAQQSWPGIDTYLASVPPPDVGLLYDPAAGAVPAKLQASTGAMRITRQQGLSLTGALDWLGQSIDANADGGA